jgi:hypothetical protein
MALEAELIHGVGLDHLCAELTVRVMTACTEDLPLFQGMMRLPVRLRPDVFVTSETKGCLFSLQKLLPTTVHSMAIVASNVLAFMPAHVPEREVFCLLMTGKAPRGPGLRFDFFPKIKNVHPASASFFYVFCACAVTGFTCFFILRSLHFFLGMNSPDVALILRYMTSFARLSADVSHLLIC